MHGPRDVGVLGYHNVLCHLNSISICPRIEQQGVASVGNCTIGAVEVFRVRGGTPAPLVKIFIVHGRAHRDAVERVVEQATGRRAIVPQEEPDGGSTTVIEKLGRAASRARYVVVILSGDDEGRLRGTDTGLHPRAEQNVIAEFISPDYSAAGM